MTLRRVLLPLVLLLAGGTAAAQNYGYGQGDAPDYAPGYPQAGYDTDGQSVDSIQVFFEPLSHYGRWLDSRYGRVWAPNVPRDWRPYTIGHWEQGAYGQTWRSDEPFGWAVFHFGRWAFDPQIGWVWSPDTVWGPGWVAWRDSDDVTGWAPLPPQASVGFAFGSGYGFNDWGYDQWYAPAWVYVPRGYLYSRSLRGAFLPSGRNRDFWEHTRGVTRYDRVDGQVVNRSFGFGGRDGRDGNRDGRRDWRGGDPRRDGGRDPRAVPPLTTSQQRQVPPAAGSNGVPRDETRSRAFQRDGMNGRGGFAPRDGFVPGSPPPTFDRRAVAPPMAAPTYRQAAPQPFPARQPATAAPPPIARPQPSIAAPPPMAPPPRAAPEREYRPETRATPRERNADAKPN